MRRSHTTEMNQATRERMWIVLNAAYNEVLRTLQRSVPDVKMEAGHHHNDAFLFWSYAEYVAGQRAVTISFNVQAKESQLKIWGDLAMEDGFILEDIM